MLNLDQIEQDLVWARENADRSAQTRLYVHHVPAMIRELRAFEKMPLPEFKEEFEGEPDENPSEDTPTPVDTSETEEVEDSSEESEEVDASEEVEDSAPEEQSEPEEPEEAEEAEESGSIFADED